MKKSGCNNCLTGAFLGILTYNCCFGGCILPIMIFITVLLIILL